jgi:serine protease AprX
VGLLAGTNSQAYINHPAHRVNNSYFRMSGTSMSAPIVSGAVAQLLQDEWNLNPDQVKYRLMATANKNWAGYNSAKAGAGYLDIYAGMFGTTTGTANTGILPSQLLSSGSEPISWGSVGWNSVGWNSVGWNSVGWNSVGWNSVGWNTNLWDD